ncbi:MAG: hypothetical protein KJO07_23940, partial [Deltaproteobacteria bacterium]|nr:hypothetical protein [Deltaproteobacteria bacterium]
VDLMLDTVRGVADALGSANSGLWLSNVMSTVDTGEIASALSSIAQGVTTAAGVLAMIRNSVLAPAETTFRELDRYQKQADPGAPEQAAAVLLEGADGLLALLGGMATTPGGGGPENASGSQRAGDAEQSEVATPSPADLPLQDVSPQGYESMAGESADVEEDAAGIAVRDQNRDPERAAPGGRQLAETEAADDMTGRGKPDATPDRAQVESESSEAESQMQSASAVGGTESDEYSGGGDGQPTSHASSSASEVPLEIDAGGQERVAASSRPVEAETDNSARARLEYYQNAGNPEPGQLPSSPASAPGGDHPPTTLAFLDRLKRTIAFLHETRNQATTTKSADLGPQSKSLQERGLELHKDIAARQDAHRTQEQRLGAAEISARQFKAESTRGNTALETLNRIADVSQMVGQLPGRLGATIAGLSQRIGRATKTWSFVSQQMGGQEQEVAALKARQVTEARRLEAVAERSNKASDKLAQADAALKSAGGAEAGSESAETGAIDRQLDRYKSTYNRLSAELAAWAQRNQS